MSAFEKSLEFLSKQIAFELTLLRMNNPFGDLRLLPKYLVQFLLVLCAYYNATLSQ